MNNSQTRTHNTVRIVAYGVIYKFVGLILPFIIRTMIIYLLGTSSLGISSLFSSILSFLSLAELGFSSAIVYAMYEPIATNNIEKISALLHYFRKIYRTVGLVILSVGIAIMPFLQFFTHGETPNGVNVYVLYLIYLLNTVISYFFAGYKQSLLTAYQRGDVIYKIATFGTIFVRFTEVFVIYFTRSLYAYAIVSVVGTVVTNLITAVATNRLFPEIVCSGEVSDDIKKGIKKRVSGLIGTNLNSVVVNQADNLVISRFLGLSTIAQYGNYLTILHAVTGFVQVVFSSMTASIGNKLVSDSIENSYWLFRKINLLNTWIVGWCSICMVCLFQPFMHLWLGDDFLLPYSTVVLICLYFYMYQIQRTLLIFKDAAGLWYEDRFRPYISMILNLVSNIILVQYIGLDGVVLSTVLAFAISIPWVNVVVFKHLFHKNAMRNIVELVKKTIAVFIIGSMTFYLCSLFKATILGFMGKMAVCAIVPNGMMFALFSKTKEFRELISVVSDKIHTKIQRR